MDNASRDMELLRKKQKEMLEIKNAVTEMMNFFNISRLDMVEERISELEDIWIENFQTEKQWEKIEQEIQRL